MGHQDMLEELTDCFIIHNYVLCVHRVPEIAPRAEVVHEPRHFLLPQNASRLRGYTQGDTITLQCNNRYNRERAINHGKK